MTRDNSETASMREGDHQLLRGRYWVLDEDDHERLRVREQREGDHERLRAREQRLLREKFICRLDGAME